MQVGSDEPVEKRLSALEADAAAATHVVEDRRKVIRVAVSGTGRVQEVELAPHWRRAVQAQRLDTELVALLREAAERAADAFREACLEAGLGAALGVTDAVRRGLEHVPGGADMLRQLDTEEVSEERAGGRIVATFLVSGLFSALRINTRYAIEAEPVLLGTEIRDALLAAEGAAEARRAELAAALLEGRTTEEILSEQVDRFRRRMDELADRLLDHKR